jgi:hypothetical protein
MPIPAVGDAPLDGVPQRAIGARETSHTCDPRQQRQRAIACHHRTPLANFVAYISMHLSMRRDRDDL